MIAAVLFDLDNTLIDFMRMKQASVDAAIEGMLAAGLHMKKSVAVKKLYGIYSNKGIEYQRVFQEFLKAAEGSINYKLLAAGIVAYRKAQIGVLVSYPMVVPTLIKLRERGLKLGVVSDAPRLRAWMRLVELGIQDFFDAVVTHDDTRRYKPHSAPFLAAAKKLRVKAKQCLMVGDRPERDIKGAKMLGMKTALAGYGTTKEITVHPDYILRNVTEIYKIVAHENSWKK